MQKIRIDFDNPGLPQHISAVENDSQSRFFQATLYENGKAYTAPEGATYSIMYRGFGPQNQGWYDTINDGAGKRAACSVSGNVVTCEIARQALQVPGHVSIVLCVTTGKGYMLKSWPIECDCKNDRYDSTAEVESFFYVTSVSNASWMQAIQALEELKNTIDPTLSVSGKAADAAKVGEAINAEATRAKAAEEENAKGVGQLKEEIVNLNYFDKHNPSGYTNWKNGEFVSTESFYDTNLISCRVGDKFVIRIEKVSSAVPVSDPITALNFYDKDKKWIIGTADVIKTVTTATSEETVHGLGGVWVEVTINSIENVAYFATYLSEYYWNNNAAYCFYDTKLGNTKFKGKMPYSSIYYDSYPEEFLKQTNHWKNKKWIAFGTSITDTTYVNKETGEVTGKYVPYLVNMSEMTVENYGIAGGTLGRNGVWGGSGNILDKILNTDVSNADLITIEGFVNDFAAGITIGNINDTENTTFYGSLYQAVNYCQKNSKAVVVLIGDTTGRKYTFTGSVNHGVTVDYTYNSYKDNLGTYQSSYNEAMKKFAEHCGCFFIDGVKSEINCNHPEYLIDHLHHTELGGKQFAKTIWSELKNIYPLEKLSD